MVKIDYDRNAKYFKPTAWKGGTALIVIGLLFLLSGNAGAIVMGLLIAAGGGFLIYRQYGGRPSDEEIDRQVASIMRELSPRALDKLGLDPDEVKLIDPIIVWGDYFGSLGNRNKVKKGKDGRFRSSNCEGVAIYFGDQELHAYKYQISLIAADEHSQHTDVYFYRDVVSVSTASSSIPVKVEGEVKPEVVNFELFELTTSGGTAVKCSMGTTGSNGHAINEGINRNIQGARQLIRNKKMHTS
jgi:hypothetical protein